MIEMSGEEQIRRVGIIRDDERFGRLDRERAVDLVEMCFRGHLSKLLTDAGLCSNKDISEFFGVNISTASKWQSGATSVPATHHLVRLSRRLASQRSVAA